MDTIYIYFSKINKQQNGEAHCTTGLPLYKYGQNDANIINKQWTENDIFQAQRKKIKNQYKPEVLSASLGGAPWGCSHSSSLDGTPAIILSCLLTRHIFYNIKTEMHSNDTRTKIQHKTDNRSTCVWASSPVTMFPTVRSAGIRTVGDGCLEGKKFQWAVTFTDSLRKNSK